MATPKQFAFVYIPAEDSEEIQEWQLDLPRDVDGQIACLTERLRAHFKNKSGSATTDEQREAFRQQIQSQLPQGATVNDQMMAMMLQMDSLVDSIPLILNTPAVKHVGVNLYVDDKGTAKNLPVNMRASAIAQACGKMLEVRGDAFIARVFDNDDSFVRMDFKLSEINSEAEWIKIARMQSNKEDKPAAASPQERQCASPSCTSKGTHRCSRCHSEYYCSQACQKSHWRVHKLSCTKK
ncbi:unnamed protein product [Aphanomyces euteiches]|uniref:MYND-type domain-containing protein n=1 Tax=Aphanomyces euteiches TaxID=100861 RepID=A0A6G0XYS5_9STRA|nr:hypothetical protein Ae201684_000188 [Aphanomyces euteiches]KAH9091722.1 hypothetical protein Ae201684P_011266 [Aphanomyces euteiches]KAH9156578.1 hypothetical protein AeRB84_001528 [Aphanomyces euteiches]